MAIIKKSEIKRMDNKTLNTKMIDLKRELIKANTSISMGTPPENPGRVREIKKTIARILTILNQKKNVEEITTSGEEKKV